MKRIVVTRELHQLRRTMYYVDELTGKVFDSIEYDENELNVESKAVYEDLKTGKIEKDKSVIGAIEKYEARYENTPIEYLPDLSKNHKNK